MEGEGGVGRVKEELEEDEKSVVIKEELEDSSLEDCKGGRAGGMDGELCSLEDCKGGRGGEL